MRARLADLWAHHRLLAIGFALTCLATVMFAVRTVVFMVYWSDPGHRNQPLEGWMTPRYIAYSYGVDADQLGAFLEADKVNAFRPTLLKISRARGIPLAVLERRLLVWLKDTPRPAR